LLVAKQSNVNEFSYLCIVKNEKDIRKPLNSKGAAIFKKMLEDKNAIHEYLMKGGKLSDLKDKYQFLDPLSIYKPE
jgi:hypothetical protein